MARKLFDLFTAAPLPVSALGDAERLACLRLIRSENVGPVTFRELVNHFGGAGKALDAIPDLSRRGGRRRPIRLCSRDEALRELELAAQAAARAIFTIEPGYPAALAAVDVPPPLLYVKGVTAHFERPMLAIVGSRQCSAAGQKLARHFAADLGRAGFAIVSGLARGIDGAAHEAALESATVAVLAGGIDIVYPPEHANLQRAIGERGCLVTEQPPGFQPRGADFPRRNRIISGLSLGVLVIEAARRSGSLVTARYAAEQGREVFAVPGHPLDPRAEGTNSLIKSGATLVTEPADIRAALAPLGGGTVPAIPEARPAPAFMSPPPEPTDPDRARVLAALGHAPVDIDSLARATGLPARSLQAILMELDLAGRIERHGAQLISLSSPLEES